MSSEVTSDPSITCFPGYYFRITFQGPCPALCYYHCPNCGYLVQSDWSYCPKCGCKLCSIIYTWEDDP